jgi:hypothetical protein
LASAGGAEGKLLKIATTPANIDRPAKTNEAFMYGAVTPIPRPLIG